MEDQEYRNTRRRRKINRSAHEKHSDFPYNKDGKPKCLDDNSSQTDTTNSEVQPTPQVVRMQIRLPGPISAMESKILRRRDKTFENNVARSQSQPRQADRLSTPEASELIQTAVKRSLSTPRQKEENLYSNQTNQTNKENQHTDAQTITDDKLSRLDRNLKRFEEERKRFAAEKRHFEREKLRCRQIHDMEERKRLVNNLRKLSDRVQLPLDAEEHNCLVNRLRLQCGDIPPMVRRRKHHSGYEESSTQFSSSEAEEHSKRLINQTNAVRANAVAATQATQIGTVGGTPAETPKPPARKSVSRNNSLSPIRPARRSKTPEQRNDIQERSGPLFKADEPQKPNQMPEQTGNISVDNNASANNNVPKTNNSNGVDHSELENLEIPNKIISMAFLKSFYKDLRDVWVTLILDYPQEVEQIKILRNKCCAHTIILIMLCGFGGLIFRYTEGTSENIYKCEVRKVKRDFIDTLWTFSHNMREDDWKSLARQKLRKFEEELHELQELGVRRHPGMKSWNFVNCLIYCWTIITTIGYGHITPKTTLGQSITIIYAIIGIPIFLILLADFGKLFTRGMKFLWAYVRRVYYTGTCRKIRKQQQVRDAMSGFNTVYDLAIRRPSHFFSMGANTDIESQASPHPETPTSPYPETFEVDDEFNLPVSLASILLITYILLGAFVYTLWEEWTYFEAFYFVFVSMSTIGFGDFVPNHPIFMMCSIIYLVFGLALTSMFINVVQIKLSDHFKTASAKIGATIGIGLASEMGDECGSQMKTPSDLASVHGSRLDKINEDEFENHTSAPSPVQKLPSILRPTRPVSPYKVGSKTSDASEFEVPPPLLPRRQMPMEQNTNEYEKKKKRRFFN